MVETYWGLIESPFGSPPPTRFIYRGETLDEAHARLQFLIDQRRRLGILWGEAGVGKTLLLQFLAGQLRNQGKTVSVLSPVALSSHDFLWEIAVRLGLNPGARMTVGELWNRILGILAVERRLGTQRIVMVDDFDRADSSLASILLRLLQQDSPGQNCTTFILTGNPRRQHLCDEPLLERSELRVELGPWTLEETIAFLEESLGRAGATRAIFERGAMERLHYITQGIPRQVTQLADWALLAGAGQQLSIIDAYTIDAVRDELCPLQRAG
jgi:general secretion pathway protein A